jgi:hypothetical protein
MDRETAIEFVKRIELAFAHMGEAGELVKSHVSEDALRKFSDMWGRAIIEIDLGVLEVIYRAHPDLRPAGMVATIPLGCLEAKRKPDHEKSDDS